MVVSYDYIAAESFASFFAECAPFVKTVFCPVYQSGYAQEKSFAENHKTAFGELGITFAIAHADSTFEVHDMIEHNADKFDAMLLANGGASFYFHKLCAYVATHYKKPLFTGNFNEIKAGEAAFGYGGDYTEVANILAAQIEEAALNRRKNFESLPGIIHATVPRGCAVNPQVAPAQGLDPDLLISICKKYNGVIF